MAVTATVMENPRYRFGYCSVTVWLLLCDWIWELGRGRRDYVYDLQDFILGDTKL